ncbi:MAG: asparagine synthetase B, partial [Fibrobacteria bacterium]
SFLLEDIPNLKKEAAKRGVLFEPASDAEIDRNYVEIESSNMDKVLLEKAPRIAVYTPLTKQPWDDAVTLAMTYSEIPYTKIYDKEIIEGKLSQYDWLHLHHEDFTGQYSKFYSSFHSAPWYVNNVAAGEKLAGELGFKNNVFLKKAVVLAIRDYVEKGGFLFAMCLACNTLDMALASVKTDAVDAIFDGTPPSPRLNKELDYNLSLAFTGFTIDPDPMSPSHGDIDYNQVNSGPLRRKPANDFVLFDFSPKYDPVPAMLCQNHTDLIKGFFGLATSFPKVLIKKSITILGEANTQDAVRYLHGNLGQGQFTYYGGHDPEDYSHAVGDAPTDLSLHKNSPGYRLILNNVLYPAARQKKRKT